MRLIPWRREASFVSKLPARLVVITCLILVVMVLALAWTREAGNSGTREADEVRITAAIDTQLHRLALDAMESPGTRGNAPDGSNSTEPQTADTSRADLIDLERQTGEGGISSPLSVRLAETLSRPLAEIRIFLASTLRGPLNETAPHANESLRLYPRNGLSGISQIDGALHAWVLVPAIRDMNSGRRHTFAALRHQPVDAAFLARVAVEAKSGFVSLHTEPQFKSGLYSFPYNSRGTPVFVAWKPDRPGDRLSNQLGALLTSIMAVYTGFVAYYMTRKLAESEVEKAKLATQDSLTGVANRLLFTIQVEDEIDRARHNQKSFALFYLDLDRFKEVNDSFGHDTGDQLIVLAARRIGEGLRAGDRLGRFGGDEFGVLQYDTASIRDCELLANRLLKSFERPFNINGVEVFIGVSIGIAVSQKGSEDRSELMRRADLALYRAKSQGRGRFIFFDDAMNSELQRQKTLEDELRHALKHNEFDVHYQPIVAAGTHRLAGVEALVRWNHPERGIVTPQEFIAIAEERGLIIELGEWVLRRACEDAIHWPGIKLAVNVSALQFRHQDFVSGVIRILQETGFEPTRLELEMTESVVVDNADQAEKAIVELRAMGVRFALDDFGTGYSSLIYLRRFAIDKIKIDRSFVEMMDTANESMEIVRNVADLGCRLGLTVTAEGVEHEGLIAKLEEFGCHELQGYLFGKPVSRLNIPILIASQKVRASTEDMTTKAA